MASYSLQTLTIAAIVIWASIHSTSGLYLTESNHSPCTFTASIRILDCSGRSLTEVPGVDSAMAVSVFYLDNNAIVTIGANAFSNLSTSLTLLSIKSTAMMDRIDNSAFAGLTALKSLTVEGRDGSQTGMNKVNIANLLSGLRSLTSLSLSKVNINELPINFAGATSIADLSLVRTAIATINQFAFSNVSNLRTLDLSENSFTGSGGSMNWLGVASNLESGKFTGCGITSDYLGQIPTLPKLKKLDLSSNALDRLLTNSLDNVATTLEELLLSTNTISESNTHGLAGLVALKKLTMVSDSQLSAIPPQVKQLQGLELLDLRGTKVAGVPADSFHSSSKLRTLKLDYTNVQSVHALAFAKLTYLEEFTLSASALNTTAILNTAGVNYPGNWSIILAQIPRLQTLGLSGTDSTEDNSGGLTDTIWDSLRLLASLQRLTLDYNKITSLPDFYLSTFSNLTYVSLGGNRIDRVTSAALYGMGGAQLHLQGNRISTIDNCTLAMYTNLTRVSLIGNPFKCNCAMQWLWLRVKSDSQINLASMQCSQPAGLAGRPWNTLTAADFCASGEVPPNNCSVLVPTTMAPTTATFRYLLNITISKGSESAVSLEADVAKLAGQFAGYTVQYWPVLRPEAALNTSLLPITTGVISLQVGINEMYRYCYALSNGTSLSVESPANCRDFTLNGLASAAVIAIAVLAAIIGVALIFVAVCLLCKKLRHMAEMKAPPADEDPYTYTYPDEKQIGKQPSGSQGNNGNQFQATLRPESKRFSKRSRTNLAGSRPSLATSTTTLGTSRMSSPGFAMQNGARPASGHSVMQQPQQMHNPMIMSGAQSSRSMHSIADEASMRGGHQQQLSRSQDHLSDSRRSNNNRAGATAAGRVLPPPPRQAHSQELVLDVTQAAAGRYPRQQPQHHQQQQQQRPPSLPPPRNQLSSGAFVDGPYLPMSATSMTGESSTDDLAQEGEQPPLSPTYNAYLPEEELRAAMQEQQGQPQYPMEATTAQQMLTTPNVRVAGGVDNSAFQRNEASGYYEMGQF